MTPNAGMPLYHKHKHSEEIYVFIRGQGEFQVDGDIFSVHEGTVVKVAPAGERCWRNTGPGDLYYVVIQVAENSYQHGTTIQDGIGLDREVTWNG